jgi:uncharacterized repeat protein (TIGR03943 family)
VTPLVGGTTVLLVGVMLIRLTVTDAYQRYVRVGMGPWLLVAGVLLALLGASAVLATLWGSGADSEDLMVDVDQLDDGDQAGHSPADHNHAGHGEHDHDHANQIGWLLLVPVLALLLVVPPALGSFGVDRSRVTAAPSGAGEYRTLVAGATPHPMTMLEFDQRAFDHGGASMRGVPVKITGFVARPQDGAGFQLARYQIACCAADAVAAVARVAGASGAAPTRDAWFTVTGVFTGLGKDGVPEFRASAVQQITAPVDPYE